MLRKRTPNWSAALHNGKISDVERHEIRARYDEIFALRKTSPGCYIRAPDPRKTLEVSPKKREAFWEKLYASPGFGACLGARSGSVDERDQFVDDRRPSRCRGEAEPRIMRYSGGDPAYREHCDAVAADNYRKLAPS